MTTRSTRRNNTRKATARKAAFAASAGFRVMVRRDALESRAGAKRWDRIADDVLAAELAEVDAQIAEQQATRWMTAYEEMYHEDMLTQWDQLDEADAMEWWAIAQADGKEAADAWWAAKYECDCWECQEERWDWRDKRWEKMCSF